MKRLMVAFALMSVSGCLCAKECKTEKDCGTGQICGTQNLCETPGGSAGGSVAGGSAAGGRAGGAAGGSVMAGGSAGGSVMGGGTAGGSVMAGGAALAGGAAGGAAMAGGAGGGTTAGGSGGGMGVCACTEFQQCVSGQCVQGALTVQFPVDGMPHPAGAPLGVAATLTFDGGAWPVGLGIPYTAAWGGSGVLPADGGLVLVPVPTNPLQRSIVIGWTDGGPGPITRNVTFLTCQPSVVARCEAYERCAPDADGGVCKPFQVVMTWMTPTAGLRIGPMSPNVPLSLTVEVDGGPLPISVPIRFDGGLVATANQVGMTSTYSAQPIQFNSALAPMDGLQGLTAGWPVQGPSVTQSFRWDSTGPGLTIRVQDSPMRPPTWPNTMMWRKDEVAQVEVRSTEALSQPPSLEVVGAADGGVVRVGTDAGCSFTSACMQARCDCFEVDFARIPLNVVTGSVAFTVRGQDLVSNSASVADSIQVTRVKWQTSVAGLSGPVEPALDVVGNVYVGGASAATTGLVAQVRRDGVVGWAQSYGAVTAPVLWSPLASLGDAGVFVATKNGTQAQIRALDATNGTVVDPGLCVTSLAGALYSGRMVSLGATVVTARENGSSQQEAYIANPVSGNCTPNGTIFLTGKASLVGRGLVGGGTELFAASNGINGLFRLTTNATGTGWTGSTDGLAGITDPVGSLVLAGSRGVLTRPGSSTQGVFAHNLSLTNGSVTAAFSSGATLNWTGATVGPASTTADVYFASPAGTTAGELFRTTLTVSDGGFSPNTQVAANRGAFSPTANSFSPAHAPVLGQGGLVYTVSTNGDISVFSTGGGRLWSGVGVETQFGAVSVPPLLDIARDSAGSRRCDRPGILYVVSNSGTVTAFIVDSLGLDQTAAWPRFQHDNANSGNADTDLSAWGCP